MSIFINGVDQTTGIKNFFQEKSADELYKMTGEPRLVMP